MAQNGLCSLCLGRRKTNTATGGGDDGCVQALGPGSGHLPPGIGPRKGMEQSLSIRPAVGSGHQGHLALSLLMLGAEVGKMTRGECDLDSAPRDLPISWRRQGALKKS